MFYSRASEALFLFIRLLLAGSVAYGTYLSKPAVGEIIKKCGIIKRFSNAMTQYNKITALYNIFDKADFIARKRIRNHL